MRQSVPICEVPKSVELEIKTPATTVLEPATKNQMARHPPRLFWPTIFCATAAGLPAAPLQQVWTADLLKKSSTRPLEHWNMRIPVREIRDNRSGE